jgi:lipoprotein-releasing system permease protein
MGMMPKMKRFRVKGIFYSGMYEFDLKMAFVSLESAQRFFSMGDRVSGITIKTSDIYKVKEIVEKLPEDGVPFLDQGLDGDEPEPL